MRHDLQPSRRSRRPLTTAFSRLALPILLVFLSTSLVGLGCGDEPASADAAPAGGGGGGGGGGGPPQGPPPAYVRMAPVERAEVEQRREMTGNLRAKRRSRVATVEPGRVVAVEFDEAQQVSEGDVLVRIDDRRLREDLAQAEAQIAVAEAAVTEQQAQLQRAQADLEAREAAAEQTRGAVSDIELRQARTTAAVAEAQLNAAQKQLAAAQTRLSRINVQLQDVVIRAPFDGTVLSRSAELGEYLSAGAVVGEIASDDIFEAVVEVPEGFDYSALDSADPSAVTVTVDTHGLELTPLSLRVVPDVDPRSRRFALVADVKAPGTERRLAAGMSVTASVPMQSSVSRLTVPYNALRRDGAGTFVFLVVPGQAGQSAVPIGVDVLFRTGARAVIEDHPQLREGTNVVIEGGERLRPGQPVQTTTPTTPTTTDAQG